MEKLHELTVIAMYMIYFSDSRKEYINRIRPFLMSYSQQETINATNEAFRLMKPKWGIKILRDNMNDLYNDLENAKHEKSEMIRKMKQELASKEFKLEINFKINEINRRIKIINDKISNTRNKIISTPKIK